MDVIYNFLSNHFAVSPLNTALLGIIFYLARQRYQDQAEILTHLQKRNERVERSIIKAGIELLEME